MRALELARARPALPRELAFLYHPQHVERGRRAFMAGIPGKLERDPLSGLHGKRAGALAALGDGERDLGAQRERIRTRHGDYGLLLRSAPRHARAVAEP